MTTEIRISPAARIAVWAVLCSCWLVQALRAQGTLDADAVSYLDISYACLRGNWHALVNGYWSPAFPILLALWMKAFRVGPSAEILAINLFAVASLVAALVAFEYFLSAFFNYRRTLAEENPQELKGLLPDDVVRLLGYILFFWISTFLTPPYLQQPDILVFVLYLIASALGLQLASTSNSWWRYALLGFVLGLAYLTKVVMFPLALSFFAALLFRREWKRVVPRLLLAVAVFAAVCAPFIVELSHSKRRLTYGDAGVVNYRHIMGMDVESGGDTGQSESPQRPQPAAAPHLQDFSAVLQLGTYPPWADPSYSYAGAPVHFDLRRQINRTHIVLHYYFELYIEQLGSLVTGLLVLILCGGAVREFCRRLLRHTVLWIPAVAGLGMYALVRAEGRMLAGFTIGLFAACCAAVRVAETDFARKVSRAVALAVALMLLSQVANQVGHEVVKSPENGKFPDWQVANALREMGVQPGQRVSYLGYALTDHAWAHLSRVTLSAEIPEEDVLTFWAASETERAEATTRLSSTGARALVARNVPATAMSMGWTKVGDTNYYVLLLP